VRSRYEAGDELDVELLRSYSLQGSNVKELRDSYTRLAHAAWGQSLNHELN
jgi:hypothetical protein